VGANWRDAISKACSIVVDVASSSASNVTSVHQGDLVRPAANAAVWPRGLKYECQKRLSARTIVLNRKQTKKVVRAEHREMDQPLDAVPMRVLSIAGVPLTMRMKLNTSRSSALRAPAKPPPLASSSPRASARGSGDHYDPDGVYSERSTTGSRRYYFQSLR